MNYAGTLFNMVKDRRKTPPRGPAQKVWTRIYLQDWRKHRGLSQETLAERAGVSPGLISQIENGLSAGSPESLEALAKALDCEVGELLDIRPGPGGSVLRLWIDDENRAQVEAMARAISQMKSSKS